MPLNCSFVDRGSHGKGEFCIAMTSPVNFQMTGYIQPASMVDGLAYSGFSSEWAG